MDFTFNLPKGNWTETQHRNRRGGITKKYRTPNGLSFTFNIKGSLRPHSKGQGCRYRQRRKQKKQNRNFRGGKHARNSQCWRQHKRNNQQHKEQRQPESNHFHETVSPSDFEYWGHQNRLSPMSVYRDYAWQPLTPITPSQQRQVEDEYSLKPPEQRQPHQVPSQFHEILSPREPRAWDYLNHFNQAAQDKHAWQPPVPVTLSQQQQSDTGCVLDQVIEKMRQERQSQTQLEQLRTEKQRQLQQCIDDIRRKYQLAGQDKQFGQQGTNTQPNYESSRSPTLRGASGIDEDDESVIFNGCHYL